MQFSPQQEEALRRVARWLDNPDKPWFYLAGYAGTGKTTLAKEFASGVGGGVCFAAYTGKAAYVLQSKGCVGATTLHRLIYKPKDKSKQRLQELTEQLDDLIYQLTAEEKIGYPDDPGNPAIAEAVARSPQVIKLKAEIEAERSSLERPLFALNLESEVRNAKLVVVDECSMVDEQMGKDLLSFEVPVLVLGDPAQLPPVRGEGFFTQREPDFLLTEIHRQARDNPILRLATDVREGRGLPPGEYGDSRVIEISAADESLYLAHDQMLVGRNEMRKGCNRKIRRLRGRDQPMPVPGDRLVCLRNNHEVGLLNGGIWEALDAVQIDADEIGLTLKSEDGTASITTTAHTHYFLGEKPLYWHVRERDCFDFGYALTVHKSQGSQWDSVLVFDESWFMKNLARNWMYTAITRAAKRVTIVRPRA